MLILALAAAFLGLVSFVIYKRAPVDGYFSPLAAFGVGAAFYLVAIPVETLITDFDALQLSGTAIPISPRASASVIAHTCIAFAFLAVGYSMVAKRRPPENLSPDADNLRPAIQALAWLTAVFVAFAIARFHNELAAARDYQSLYSTRYSSPLYNFTMSTIYALSAMLAAALLVGRRTAWGFALVAALLLGGVYSNQKEPLVLAGLALLVLLPAAPARPRLSRITLAVFAAPAMLTAATIVFSVNRGGGTVAQALQLIRAGSLNRTEPAGPFSSVLAELYAPGSSAPQSAIGDSFINGLIGWIPRVLRPGRPLDLAEAFARNNIPGWTPGRGYGYSPLAEGLHQGGAIGVMVWFTMLGLFIGGVYALFNRHQSSPSHVILWVFGRTAFVALIFTSLRAPFQGLVTSLVQYAAVLVMVCFVALLFNALRREAPGVDAALRRQSSGRLRDVAVADGVPQVSESTPRTHQAEDIQRRS